MADNIQMQVTRYDPDTDSKPTVATYEVPLRQDWAILDGLNYVKDHVDSTLSYRWSCRMGICGSCGMNVEGEPKLTCATFLSDYAPGPVRVEPLTNFPVVRDLVVDIEDFMEKLPRVKPWIIRDDEKSVRSTIRSRITGKLASGSMRTGPGARSIRNVAQVSLGSPSIIMPQLPQMPIRHDHRYDSVPSSSSLM